METPQEKFRREIREIYGYDENYYKNGTEINEKIVNNRPKTAESKKELKKSHAPQLKPPMVRKRREFTGRKKIAVLVLAGALLIGGKILNDTQAYENRPITLGEALTQTGDRPEDLGIEYSDVEEFTKIKDAIENKDKYITDEEVKAMLPKIHKLGINALETKAAKALNLKDKNSVRFDCKYINLKGEGNKTQKTLTVSQNDGQQEYFTSTETFDLKFRNTIPTEMSDQIEDIKQIENIMGEIQNGNFNKNEVIKKEEKAVDNLGRFMAMKFKKDNNGNNIIAEVTRSKDLKKNNEKNIDSKTSTPSINTEEIDNAIEEDDAR